MKHTNKIIFPLDVSDTEEALEWTRTRLPGFEGLFKVGMQAFYGCPMFYANISRKHRIMLDLKLCDIPATVEKACRSLASLFDPNNTRFVTVHCSGGRDMCRAAIDVFGSSKIVGVTVLTSLDYQDTESIFGGSALDATMSMAGMAWEAGIRNFVCSPREVSELRELLPSATFIVPGIRPEGASEDDQVRIDTPFEAIRNGADYLVIGRPIRNAPDPTAALRAISDEIGLHFKE